MEKFSEIKIIADELNIGLQTAEEIINDMENRSEGNIQNAAETCGSETTRHGEQNNMLQHTADRSYRMKLELLGEATIKKIMPDDFKKYVLVYIFTRARYTPGNFQRAYRTSKRRNDLKRCPRKQHCHSDYGDSGHPSHKITERKIKKC